MKKEEFIKEVFEAYKTVTEYSVEMNELLGKRTAITIAIEAVKQDIEDRKRKEVFGSLFIPKERD